MAAQAFLFGKLPSHGDFVWRGLTAQSREVWDSWASGEIEASIEALGERFGDAHDRALPCRFITGGADQAAPWRAGVLSPSIDSAGRRFLVVVGFEGLTPGEAAVLGAAISDRCESLLRRALVEPLSADDALQGLAAAAPCAGEIAAAEALGVQLTTDGVWWRPGDGSIYRGAAPPVGLLAMALKAAPQLGGGA